MEHNDGHIYTQHALGYKAGDVFQFTYLMFSAHSKPHLKSHLKKNKQKKTLFENFVQIKVSVEAKSSK